MELLRQLLEIADFVARTPSSDKYPTTTSAVAVSEEVNDIVDVGPDYVPMVKPGNASKKKRRQPTTDKAENSLINTRWFYNNSDAS